MTDMKYTFLDDLGTQEFIDIMLELAEIHFDDRLTDNLDDETDDEHIPTVLSIIKAFKKIAGDDFDTPQDRMDYLRNEVGLLARRIHEMTDTDLSIQFVTGFMPRVVPDPSPYVLYFHRDSESCVTYTLMTWSEKYGWTNVGDTAPELIHYWKKTNLAGLREAIYSQTHECVLMPEATIRAKVNKAFDKVHGIK